MRYMTQSYSIAQARDRLPSLVRAAERGAEIELTRRGQRVAVLVSIATHERLNNAGSDFWARLTELRSTLPRSALVPRDQLEGLRQRDAGRPVRL